MPPNEMTLEVSKCPSGRLKMYACSIMASIVAALEVVTSERHLEPTSHTRSANEGQCGFEAGIQRGHDPQERLNIVPCSTARLQS